MTGTGNNNFNLSNGYNSNSYIFNQVPPYTQAGLWTWAADYAKLALTNTAKLNSNAVLTGLQLVIPNLYTATYSFTVNSAVLSVNNLNISVPAVNDIAVLSKNFLNVSGYMYSPIKSVGSGCTGLANGIGCDGWVKISENGTLGSAPKQPLNIYIGYPSTASDPSASFSVTLLAASPSGGLTETNAMAGVNSINVSEVPYFLYKSAIPSAYTQLSDKPVFYNSSYSMYAVHNYINPQNSLEPYSLSTITSFFGTYNDYLSVYPANLVTIGNGISSSLVNPQNNILTMLLNSQASQINQGSSVGGIATNVGKYPLWTIHNPIFMAAAPNGYIYVINSSTNTCPYWYMLCIGTSTTSYLFIMRYVPEGYANLTNDQPTTVPSTSDLTSWISGWKTYYANSILEGSQSLYLTNIYQMTSTYSSWITGTSSNGGAIPQLIPVGIATDNNGDVFLLGAHSNLNSNVGGSLLGGSAATTSFQLAGVLFNNDKISSTMTQPQVSGKPPFVPSDEFAAAPGGQYVYVANVSYWNSEIEVYSTGTGSTSGSTATNTALTAPAPAASSTTISSGSSVTLTASPTGGSAPYTFQWYSGGSPTCQQDSLVTGASASSTASFTDSPTTTTYYCYEVSDSSVPSASVYSATTQVTVSGSGSSTSTVDLSQYTCPNNDAVSGASALSFYVVVKCAENAGFSGTQLIQIVSIAFAESSFRPGVITGTIPNAPEGILQEGAGGAANGEQYPLSDYTPSTCSTYSSTDWSTIYTNPQCAFQWAYAYEGASVGTSCSAGAYCFWGTYIGDSSVQPGDYCQYSPISYSGYDCSNYNSTGDGENKANLPWASVGLANGGGGSSVTTTIPQSTAPTQQILDTFIYSGNIPLSYSNNTASMNITAYLANGGPYDDPTIAAAYKGLPSTNDVSFFHHPVSIVDSKGILYVIDNWTIYVDSMQSTILMLRAFSENGTEIPINPSSVNTSLSSAVGPALTKSKGGGIDAGVNWRPFGWPLSANITTSQGTTVSYCAALCNYDPASIKASTIAGFNSISYPPIGPFMSATSTTAGPWNSLAISGDFNGTLYIIAHPWSYTTKTTGCGIGSWFNYGVGLVTGKSPVPPTCIPVEVPNKELYAELLTVHPTIQNYTKISLAENNSYLCYLSIAAPSGSQCISDQNTQAYLPYLYAPILGVPSSFSYVESLGNPEQYLNLPNAFSATFPTGVDNSKYSSQASQRVNNGISNPNYGSLSQSTPSSGSGTFSQIPNTYLKSGITGYVITPFNIILQLKQSYAINSCVPTDAEDQFRAGTIACGVVTTSGLLSQTGLFNGKKQYYTYIATPLTQTTGPISSSASLNTTIEGGSIYLQYLPGQTNYIPNLSDTGLIIPPYINYQVFTNRLFGEIFVNQTVSPTSTQGGSPSVSLPVVINATNNYQYSETDYVQQASGTYNGFSVQIATQLTNPNVGVNCGSSCPSNYYYNPSRAYGGSSNLTYNHTAPQLPQSFQLAELLKVSKYIDNLVLDLTTQPGSSLTPAPLGYNRLMYTYIDRFNNTIYMPLDVDFANITQLSLTTSEVINTMNTNETAVTINGIALYSTPSGPTPVPTGTPIYLYYDTNINYLNGTSSPSQNPVQYYENAIICAFAPQSKSCILANPLSTLTQPQPNGVQEANTVSYKTDTNSMDECAPQPNSLLQLPAYNCNIYGTDGTTTGLTQAQYDSYANFSKGGYQYCLPVFVNGTGRLTTQLGLIAIVKTTQNGNFSDAFTACGTGINRVTAYYYGTNAPEPTIVKQAPLSQSAGTAEFSPSVIVNSIEFNYTFSPNSTTQEFAIGSYALSIGSIGILELALAIGVIALIIFAARGRKQKRVN